MGRCRASAIAITHMRAHRAREKNSTRLVVLPYLPCMFITIGLCMYVYYYRTYEKAVSGGGEREKGGRPSSNHFLVA